ncbi:MAG: carbohydrate porin [Acidobacteriota bacterium]
METAALRRPLTIGFGQVDATDYTDPFLGNPVWGFQNLVFSTSPAIPFPNQGLGAAIGGWLSENVYGTAGIADANGDPKKPFNNVFDDGETFQHAEIGFTSSRDRLSLDNLHMTLWHQDKRRDAGTPDDWGVSASLNWGINNSWCPFLRAGWNDRGTVLYKESVSAGLGYLTRQQDIFGFGLNWGRPGGNRDLNNQWTIETFYKYQATEIFAITPDVQVILNPANNPGQDLIAVFGLRARLIF